MAEALGTVHTQGRGLIRGLWWPGDPKLVFDDQSWKLWMVLCIDPTAYDS
jgi:hypothetical protein